MLGDITDNLYEQGNANLLVESGVTVTTIAPAIFAGGNMAMARSSFGEMLAFAGAGSSAGPQRLIDMADGGSLAATQADLKLLSVDAGGFDPMGPADMLRMHYATAYLGMYAQAYAALDDQMLWASLGRGGSQFGGPASSPEMLASLGMAVGRAACPRCCGLLTIPPHCSWQRRATCWQTMVR